jgi:hypothetical protein
MSRNKEGLEVPDDIKVYDAKDVVLWWEGSLLNRGQLKLPPIQRRFVWDNNRIVAFWDSLMRGFPIGLFLVHDAKDEHGITMLFDGQQRLAALMLGYGKGPLAQSRRLYVENDSADELPRVRITSQAQPLGYHTNSQNERPSQEQLRAAVKIARPNQNALDPKTYDPVELYNELDNRAEITLVGGKVARPLKQLLAENESAALARAKNTRLVFQTIIPPMDLDYALFFERVGQGGMRLSKADLLYSLIKYFHPKIAEPSARAAQNFFMVDELEFALASLRLVVAEYLDGKEVADWLYDRPHPALLKRILSPDAIVSDSPAGQDWSQFRDHLGIRLLSEKGSTLELVRRLEKSLRFHLKDNPRGLPEALLTSASRSDFVDCTVWLARCMAKSGQIDEHKEVLISFALYWLFFVKDPDKAARQFFWETTRPGWTFEVEQLKKVLEKVVSEGYAHALPSRSFTIEEIETTPDIFPPEAQFLRPVAGLDTLKDKDQAVLSHLATSRPHLLLAWSQRGLDSEGRPKMELGLEADLDHRFDLDHLIPQSLFKFYFLEVEARGITYKENSRRRDQICEMLGNKCWLRFDLNRARSNGEIAAEYPDQAIAKKRADWNRPIKAIQDGKEKAWTGSTVDDVRNVIFERTLDLIKELRDAGLEEVAPVNR